jgi:heme-degrading monooxygenase HmoA
MAHAIHHITVADNARWKPIFDEDSANRGASGSRGGQLFRSESNPNELIIIFEWDSLENAHEFSQSPGLREKMQQAGVNGHPEIFYLDKVEDVTK